MKINTEAAASTAGSKPTSPLTHGSPCSVHLACPVGNPSMPGRTAGTASMSSAPPPPSSISAAPEMPGEPLGWEHPTRGLNASPHRPSSPAEECESCCPHSPLLLPRWDSLQHSTAERRGRWWWEKTMASGTCPREGNTTLRVCWAVGWRGREGRGKEAQPSPGSSRHSISALPLAPFASQPPFPHARAGLGGGGKEFLSSWMKSFVKSAHISC